jgi:hypothetical protein
VLKNRVKPGDDKDRSSVDAGDQVTQAMTQTMPSAKSPAYYRQRAAFLRTQSDKTESDDLRISYMTAAADWEKLAEQAEVALQAAAEAAMAQPSAA